MKQNQTTQINVYRDGKLSIKETYLPVIHANIVTLGNKIDFLFVNGHWPTEQS